jgi:serine/threonine protein kinase
MRAVVRITTASESRVYELSEGQKALLGRSVACDIVVNDASVSRRHCSILLEENALLVTDLESSHGIRHGNRVVAECRILKGEEVVVGLAKITLESIVVDEIVASAEVRSDQSTTGKTSHNELIGETLGGYRIASILGAGGQAVVYAAEQVRLGREVALKVLRNPDTGSTAESVASFLREARAAAALSDPRLVQVYDLGFDRDRHFLSMELVRGGSLATRIRQKGTMSWDELEPILLDVLDGLTVAHAAGIVHRDVKPANILLTPGGRAKLADLGLARGIGGEGDRSGTPAYMAPEQVKGSVVDARADLYALGCTIYHALTGSPPFVGRSKDIIKQKLSEPTPKLPEEARAPFLVRQLLVGLLQRDPAARPDNVNAVIELLREPSPVRTPSPRAARRVTRPTSSKSNTQGWHWIAAIAALAMLAATVFRLLPLP